MILHIHGFNSSAASHTYTLLRAAFPTAKALEYPCHGLFADNLAALLQHARTLRGTTSTPLVITGSSLGGFYASQLAALLCPAARLPAPGDHPRGTVEAGTDAPCHCALFNPVVNPAVALRPFLGRNTHLYTGHVWEFTPAMLASYSPFTDTRPLPLRRFVLLGRNDSLLNPQEARAYWQNCAQIHDTDDEHSLATLDETTLCALADMGAGR